MKYYFDWKNEAKDDEMEIVINDLKNDGLILLPTETVYGIAGNAYSDVACKKIFRAKGRPQDNPLIVHISDLEMLEKVAEKPNEVEEKLIKAFMPGPFTIILNKKNVICDTVSAGMSTIGVRMPNNRIIHTIIKKSQIPIAAPSANLSGKPSGTSLDDIIDELKDEVDVIIDGGECNIGIESTVVKVTNGVPIILRPGFITEEDIKKVVGKVKLDDNIFKTVSYGEQVESPGMKYRHYAPKTKCVLVEWGKQQINKVNELLKKNPNACVLGFEEDREYIEVDSRKFILLGSKNNLEQISKKLFTSLRKIDKYDNCNLAIIEGLPKQGLGLSIMSRLSRACEN
ncbi:MAG: threonylcarbamoyl-AMP synthase [Clostridia bacterium]|nr:threonylcarbamoyl-AMP synthase [Clostridia bacterium]